MFVNRKNAGEKLAKALSNYRNDTDAIVVAVPRGGLVPGKVIADELNLPLEVVLVKKIGHPSNSEYAIGAVSLKNQTLEPGLNISDEYIQHEILKNRKLLSERTALFYGDRKPRSLTGKTVILVDDGIATGKTFMAAVELIRLEKPARIIIAVPVAPRDTLDELLGYVDDIVCLETPYPFFSIGAFYKEFNQVPDEEAVKLFKSCN